MASRLGGVSPQPPGARVGVAVGVEDVVVEVGLAFVTASVVVVGVFVSTLQAVSTSVIAHAPIPLMAEIGRHRESIAGRIGPSYVGDACTLGHTGPGDRRRVH